MPKARTIAFLLAAATSLAAHGDSALAETQPCRSWSTSVTPTPSARSICVSTRSGSIGSGRTELPMHISPRCRELWKARPGRLLFATNAGMFDPALKPVGLYVEQGRELVHVNTKSGYGNFHMKPNGVFYVSADRAAVAETRAFLKQRTADGAGDAVRADAGDQWAPASSFRPAQHVAQNAQWCGRSRGWQSHVRYLSGRGVV